MRNAEVSLKVEGSHVWTNRNTPDSSAVAISTDYWTSKIYRTIFGFPDNDKYILLNTLTMLRVKEWKKLREKGENKSLFVPFAFNAEFEIISVTRIKDGAIFKIGDKIVFVGYEYSGAIDPFTCMELEDAECGRIVSFCKDQVKLRCSIVPKPEFGQSHLGNPYNTIPIDLVELLQE